MSIYLERKIVLHTQIPVTALQTKVSIHIHKIATKSSPYKTDGKVTSFFAILLLIFLMRTKEKEKYERELSILTSNISNILNQYVENICKKKFAIKKKRIAIISFYYYH